MFHNHLGSLLAAGSVAAIVCATPAAAQVGDEQIYGLPAQDLATSLREVATRSGRNIIAPSELVAGRQAPAVSGPFTAEGVVRLLLTGSGLEVRRVGASLVVAQESAGLGARRPAEQEDAAAATEETIVVTGTNIRGAQPTSPVITLRREDIEASGATSVEQLMARLPQNSQSGVNRENFRVIGAGADVTEHGAGLNLRGLGQRGTLVLINGRRVAPSNTGFFVDVSLIPLGAIERVEVLTDGASAIYGSDAVGGVVNFILRRDFEGAEASLQVGSATSGDGDVLQAGATIGTAWSSGGAMLSYEYRDEDPILAADRDITVGLAPDTFLLPRERRHSLYGSLHHGLSQGLRAELSGSFSQRETRRSYFLSNSPLPVDAVQQAETLSLSTGLTQELGGDWAARATGGYSVTTTDQEQNRATGLINARATRNAIADLGLRADGPLFDLPGGPVRVAFGVEGRREWYRDRFQTARANVPTDIARNVFGAFAEARVPIFSSTNRMPGVERLVLTLAARMEHYERYGSSFDPKVGLLWSPVPGLTFRTSYDTSFRAPLLSEAAGTYSVLLFPATSVYIDPSQAQGVAAVLGGFDPDVQPERSRSWTIGAEVAPTSGLSLSLNYYSIRFTNRIGLPSNLFAIVGDPGFESLVTRGPSAAFIQSLIDGAALVQDSTGPGFSNGGATAADVTVLVDNRISNTALSTTSGLDALLQFRFGIGTNEFLLAANANYILSFEDQLRPGTAIIDALDSPYRPLDFRARGHAGWRRGGWSANLFVNYADGYVDNRGGRSLPIDSYTTVDAGVAYQFGSAAPSWLRDARLAFQVDNVFDAAPPRLLPDPGFTTGFGYDPVNASARGRFVSLQLRTSW